MPTLPIRAEPTPAAPSGRRYALAVPAWPGYSEPIVIRAAELVERFGNHLRDRELGPLAHRPLVVVELDPGLAGSGEWELEGLDQLVRTLPCVVAGVARAGHGWPLERHPGTDVLLTDATAPPAPWVGSADTWIPKLTSACTAAPHAVVALVQLLRRSAHLSVPDGLVAESTTYSMLQSGTEHRRWLSARRPAGERPTEPPPVIVERSGPVLTVTLNRPDRHNAYSAAMRDHLVEALQLAAADPSVERILLSGAGPSFCSGGDLDEFGRSEDPVRAHAVRTTASAAAWMARCADRLDVRVKGACIGAGLELAAFAGRISADPATTFSMPEVAMGLVAGAGGTVSVPRRIGPHRAALLLLTGASIDAPTALEWGLVDRIR